MKDELLREKTGQKDAIALRWATRFDGIADPVVREAVRDFYANFFDPEKLIRWWAGLYDPEIGGFYYSNSARDNAGFLPDMESTYQILWRLHDFIPDLPGFFGPEIDHLQHDRFAGA